MSTKYKRALNPDIITVALSGIDPTILCGPDPSVALTTVYDALEVARVTDRDKVEVSVFGSKDTGSMGAFSGGGTCSAATTVVAKYLDATRGLKAGRAEIKAATEADRNAAAAAAPQVSSFMERGKITSQQIALTEDGEEKKYYLRRRTNTRRPPLNAAVTKAIIMRSIQSVREACRTDTGVDPRGFLARDIWERIRTRPGQCMVKVSLEPAPRRQNAGVPP
jgi:hypothetical protein